MKVVVLYVSVSGNVIVTKTVQVCVYAYIDKHIFNMYIYRNTLSILVDTPEI